MGRRVKLIFNPHADRGRAWDIASSLQAIIEQYGGAEWAATEYPTHATQLARQAAEAGFEVVAALGGDGTVHEVVNGLMQVRPKRRPLLAVVPIGSGNDFSSNLGLTAEVETAMHRAFAGQPRPIDVGVLRDETGRTEYWNNTLGIGFDAAVTIHSYKITRLQGFSMYLWAVIQTILRNHNAPRMTVETDQETFEQEALMLVLCNGPREGGGFYVAPEARPDDGLLQYVMIERVSRPMMFRLIPEVMKGTHARFRQVRMGSFRRLKLESAQPLPIHTDGEIFAGFTSPVRSIEVEIIPGELQVLV
jgi:YegS/Rv2252/BmrU family lipid kinase